MIAMQSPKTDMLYPLSSSQSRIWFMEKLDKDITAYNIPYDYRITGNLDPGLLEKSLDYLIERHASLRTVFPNGNGHPSQKILQKVRSGLKIIHMENEPENARVEAIVRYSFENANKKFDLGNGPLFNFELDRPGQ